MSDATSQPDPGTTIEQPARRGRRTAVALAVIALLGGAAVASIWVVDIPMRQLRYIFTAMAVAASATLVLVWLLLFAGLSLRGRMVVLSAVVAGIALAAVSVRIEGVDGDMVPIVVWRWSSEGGPKYAPPRQGGAAASAQPSSALPGLRDYPRFLGAQGDAKVDGVTLSRDWSGKPPRLVWRQPIGAGWSAFAVAGGRAVTQEQRGDDELVTCYDASDGGLLWSHAIKARYESTLGGVGPRATPTVADGRVYALGATGVLHCLDLETGSPHWSVNVLEDNGAKPNDWGVACSPLLLDGRVIVTSGGRDGPALVAYDSATGERVWRGGQASASYASPLVATFAGVRQLVIFNDKSISSHDIATGDQLWQNPWPSKTRQPKSAQPVVLPGDKLFATASYGLGCIVLHVTRDEAGAWSTEKKWSNLRMKSKLSNVVLLDGHVYGLDDGILACLDAADGRRVWKGGRYGHGQIVLVGDLLLLTAESGELVLVEASPDEHRELTRFTALDDKTWNHTALAGRYLFVRNHREAACYELPLSTP